MTETQEEQSQRLRTEVERMVKDGELNPTEADRAIKQVLSEHAKLKHI
jgi:polyhydroxyalkanoate synthesis regulator phasin